MSLVFSGGNRRVCFPARCPMCARDVKFLLRVKIVTFRPVIHGVICDHCNHEVPADSPEERHRLWRATQLWRRYENRELDAAAIASALELLRSTTLQRIIAEASTWTCPGCGHAVPPHFVTCWNCNYERPLDANERSLVPIDPATDHGLDARRYDHEARD